MELHNKIAEISLEKFSSLPRTGKPNSTEWTVMSTIVKHTTNTDNFEVISLGTGSKCIGANSMSPKGDILNDSHAEVICRRAFIKYIYNEIDHFLKSNKSDIFTNDKKLLIKSDITFHFFSTHVPCGDASIFPKNINEDFGTCFEKNFEEFFNVGRKSGCTLQNDTVLVKDEEKITGIEENEEPLNKKIKTESDIYRTGAKCLKDDLNQDSKNPGFEYHVLGAVRTKPGRGDPTSSVSCSDKIAMWTLLGIQGELLYRLLQKPIHLSTITIAGGVPYSEEAMKRAICNRIKTYPHKNPKIAQSKFNFEFCKDNSKQPCPSSIIWYKNCKKLEVAVEGKKQGVTKKNRNTKAGRLSICKKELFTDFYNIVKKYSSHFDFNIDDSNCYSEWKNSDFSNKIKKDIFKVWPYKSKELLLFTCKD